MTCRIPIQGAVSRASHRARSAVHLATALVVAGLCATAAGQYQVPQNGGALDANNRVGSGGSNVSVPYNPVNARYQANNALVTGNVTGGQAFRGAVPYRAATDFRDFTAGQSSSFFAGISSGATASGLVINNAQQVRPYYGASDTVAPPSGFVRTPGTGGYLPPTALYTPEMRLDRRLENVGDAGRLDPRVPSRLNDEAVQRPEAESRLDSTSSLLRPDLANTIGPDRGRMVSPYTQLSRDVRLGTVTLDQIQSLRSELIRDATGNRLANEQIQNLLAAQEEALRRPDPAQLGGTPVDARAGGEGIDPNDRSGALARARQSADERYRLATPAEQSAQYAQLQDRLRRFEEDPYAEALRPLMARREQERQAEEPALPGVPSVLPRPGEQANGQQDEQTGRGAAPADPPVEMRSLAAGVSSPTLKQIYEQAEQLMAQGKFVSALARYDAAERLVPNQPLTSLGRATAELGAGYYRRAAQNLRRAFEQNPELTMAQLDVSGLIGRERLQEIAESLRGTAAADRQDVDSLFLLAFIAYNTGGYEQAAAFLELAERRSEDPFFSEVRKLWALDQGGAGRPGGPATRPAGGPATQPARGGAPDLPVK